MNERVGFTGTQHGLTPPQQGTLLGLLRKYGPTDWFIHGGCVGADTEAHMLAKQQGMKIRVWPAEGVGHKAVKFTDADEVMDSYLPLVRNTYIVQDKLNHLFACPSSMKEFTRSGTWATVRRARKFNVDHSIILPNGHVDTVVYVQPIRNARGLSW